MRLRRRFVPGAASMIMRLKYLMPRDIILRRGVRHHDHIVEIENRAATGDRQYSDDVKILAANRNVLIERVVIGEKYFATFEPMTTLFERDATSLESKNCPSLVAQIEN